MILQVANEWGWKACMIDVQESKKEKFVSHRKTESNKTFNGKNEEAIGNRKM